MSEERSPLVTIVLPTRNRCRYLPDAVESCLAQTYRNLELIVVDDCSSDDTERLAKEFMKRDERVKYIRNDQNLRLPESLNAGFRAACGEYLTWTSDDNMYRANAIDVMVRYMECHPEAGMVYAGFTSVDENLEFLSEMRPGSRKSLLERSAVGGCFLYRSSVREKVGDYSSEHELIEDFDYWLRISKHTNIHALQKGLYIYRFHSDTLTTAHSDKVPWLIARRIARELPYLKWASLKDRRNASLRIAVTALSRGRIFWAGYCLVICIFYAVISTFGSAERRASLAALL